MRRWELWARYQPDLQEGWERGETEFNHVAEKPINQCLYKKTPGKTLDAEAWVNSPGGQHSCIRPHIQPWEVTVPPTGRLE